MAKQTLGQGDSNVVVRNQVVYGALPQDVIDRMGDTTLALQTTEQNVLPAINELKSNLTDLTTYSESAEKVIGEWVNGKPLYRLVISGTTHATSGTIKAIKTFSDYADLQIKNIYGTITGEYNDNKAPFWSCNYYESSSSYAYTFMRGSDNSLSVKTTATNRPIVIIIEYTRASD